MIIVDENLQNRHLISEISTWYKGRVKSVLALRPATVIKDDGIMTLLRQQRHATFVTINVTDFWLKVRAEPSFCIMTIILQQEQTYRVPAILRSVLTLPEFRTKSSRMGKVLRVAPTSVEYYGRDYQLHTMSWAGS
jgi:hypothetical protein